MNRKTVRVPASSANLGPGFDTLGMALNIYLECTFAPARGAKTRIRTSGRDCDLIATDESNLIWQTLKAYDSPPIDLEIHNDIPLGKGLGSSAAAITAAVAIASELLGWNWTRAQVLNETSRLEGHPDNVAACTYGGIVASAFDDSEQAHAIRLDLPVGIEVAVVTPGFPLPTSTARAALPDCYPKGDAIYNLQRVALMVAALATNSVAEFRAALGDRLHQPYRESLVPGLAEILKLRQPGLIGCVLSGAGPSVLVFFEAGSALCCRRIVEVFATNGQSAEVLTAQVAPCGYTITTSPNRDEWP